MFKRITNLSNRQVLELLVLFAFVNAFVSVGVIGGKNFADWLSGLTSNLATELVGAVITFIMFEMIIGGRQEQEKTAQQIAEEKKRLIRDLGSRVNDVAKKAAEELMAKGWVRDGSLRGANLHDANLQEAILREADLQETKLRGANLQKAGLRFANLQGAVLGVANLKGTDLSMAQLQGTILNNADLQGANLNGTIFGENTTLPNSKKWTPETDMSRFTDPEHPQFWRSDYLASPAYRDKKKADE